MPRALAKPAPTRRGSVRRVMGVDVRATKDRRRVGPAGPATGPVARRRLLGLHKTSVSWLGQQADAVRAPGGPRAAAVFKLAANSSTCVHAHRSHRDSRHPTRPVVHACPSVCAPIAVSVAVKREEDFPIALPAGPFAVGLSTRSRLARRSRWRWDVRRPEGGPPELPSTGALVTALAVWLMWLLWPTRPQSD